LETREIRDLTTRPDRGHGYAAEKPYVESRTTPSRVRPAT
jgi:hypothetical protein